MRRSARLAVGLLLTTALVVSAGAQEDLRRDPGFVDFNPSGVLSDDDLEIHISVKSPMIQLVAQATRESDPVLADVLDKLKGVEVHVYSVDEARREAVRKEIARRSRELGAAGWTEAIAIRLRGARGSVLMRMRGERPVGLAAMYLDDQGEAVFVNIVGPVDAAQLGRLAASYNLDVLSQAVEERREAADPE